MIGSFLLSGRCAEPRRCIDWCAQQWKRENKAAVSAPPADTAAAPPPAPAAAAPAAGSGVDLSDMPEGLTKMEQMKVRSLTDFSGSTRYHLINGRRSSEDLPRVVMLMCSGSGRQS
jgi:hypothetical protein|eukprot:COSAG03_NODE_1372_length_4223_cov_2.796314_4_plen_116_part_00